MACTWVTISIFSRFSGAVIQPRGLDDEDKDAVEETDDEDETDGEREGEIKFWVEADAEVAAPVLEGL